MFTPEEGLCGVVVAALATWQAVEVWRHGAVAASWRARVEAIDPASRRWFVRQLRAVLTCPYCLSVWVGLATTAVLALPRPTPEGVVSGLAWAAVGVAKLFVVGLAVSRVANLGNDLTWAWCRTPRSASGGGEGSRAVRLVLRDGAVVSVLPATDRQGVVQEAGDDDRPTPAA